MPSFLQRIRRWRERHALQKRLDALTEAERAAIIDRSPWEAGYFQGEGYHVFLKAEPDFTKAYVDSLGEVTPRMAEDWIIARTWKAEEASCYSNGGSLAE